MDTTDQADVFKGLTEDHIRSILGEGRHKRIAPREALFRQDDAASHCYLVRQGRLKLAKLNEHGKEAIIRYLGSGQFTAAVAVMKDGLYPVSAIAMEKTDVIGWNKETMTTLMRRYPDIAINMLNILLVRIDDVQQRYFEVCTEQVAQRIARALLRLMRTAGSKAPDGISIDIPLSRQSIADYTGTTLYTVSRTLSAWERSGWIKTGRERIVITDPHALVSFSEA